jgi:hypothetical protein
MKYKKNATYIRKKEQNERTLKSVRLIYTFISNHCLIIYEEDRPEMIQRVFYSTKKEE